MYPWHATFHMGIVHFMAYPQVKTEDEILKSVHKILNDDFFQAIEVNMLYEDNILEKISALCETADIEFLLGAQPFLLSKKINLNAGNDEERHQAIQLCKMQIERSYRCRARALTFLSGQYDFTGKKDELKQNLIHSLRELCRYSQEIGNTAGYQLGIDLEIFDHTVDKKVLIGPAPDAFDIAKSVKADYPAFSLTVDLSHLPLTFEDPYYVLKLLAPFIGHVHIGNGILDKKNPFYGDHHPRFGIAGGCNDYQEVAYFMIALEKIDYFNQRVMTKKPVISFEVKPLPHEDSDLVVANSKRKFLAALDKAHIDYKELGYKL